MDNKSCENPEKPVYFIGAGPGDPDLITLKAAKIIAAADLVIFTGSLVPREVLAQADSNAEIIDSASLNLNQTHDLICSAVRSCKTVARVHTGDPSLFGGVREQVRLLNREGIKWEIIPGVTAAFAAAAQAGISFTVPDKTQSLIVTRIPGRTPVPESEQLIKLAKHGTSLAIYLSAGMAETVQKELEQAGLLPETIVIVACKVGFPDQKIVRTRLSDLADSVHKSKITRQAVFLVLPGEDSCDHFSKLYDPEFEHGFRSISR